MEPEFHKVQVHEVKVVNTWLQSYLPESWNLFALTSNILKGLWTGQSLYTLGWPDIRAVFTGQPEFNHPCPDFFSASNYVFVYAPNTEDMVSLLECKEFMDWTKPFVIQEMPERIAMIIKQKAESLIYDSKRLKCVPLTIFHAKPGDVPDRLIPNGYRIRSVNPDVDMEYCITTFPYRRPYMTQYFKALVQRFPSVCLVDGQDACLSFELGTESGSPRFLHTRKDARRQGLAHVVISHLAKEYFKNNLDIYCGVREGNDVSISIHKSMGFKPIDGRFFSIIHNPT